MGARRVRAPFFAELCAGHDGDKAFLMYPFWNTQTGLGIPSGQIDAARIGASHLEEGKTTLLPVASMFNTGLPPTLPVCQAVDNE